MKYLIILLTIMIVSRQASAQSETSVRQVSEQLEKSNLFRRLGKFRTAFENLNADAGKYLQYYQDYIKLNIAYNQVCEKYNNLLSDVKADLSDWKTIKRLLRQPEDFAGEYFSAYNELVEDYQKNYLPIYNEVTSQRQKTGPAKAIPPQLLVLGITLFNRVADLIKSRSEEKEMSLNAVMGTINVFFYEKLKMRSWAELGIQTPDEAIANQSGDAGDSAADSSEEPVEETYEDVNVQVEVPGAVFEQLHGWLEFNSIGRNAQPQRMGFFREVTKDIDVATFRADQGNVTVSHTDVGICRFNSINTYGEGVQFQLKVYNTAGMYVFALNQDNKVKFLYPYENELPGDCTQQIGGGKDIDVLPATFVVGRDRNQVTTLPPPDCSTTPPAERYFTITGDSRKEIFCVLLTKSEINTDALSKALEAMDGDIEVRLARVFAKELISADNASVTITDNKLEFDAGETDNNILPVLFYIMRTE